MVDYTFYDTSSGAMVYGCKSSLPLPASENIPTGYTLIVGIQSPQTTLVNGVVTPWPDDQIQASELEEYMETLRSQRNKLLTSSDWTQTLDSPLTDAKRQEWATYRQALRDLPSQPSLDPANPSWPTEPTT
jgi:hypothetical protein